MPNKTFPGNYESLEAISKFIIRESKQANFSPSDVYAIQTAVDEACANIIDHAYGGENIGKISISVSKIKDGIQIVLHDTGEPFDPGEVPEPDITSSLEIRKERGLGIFFMRQLMDKVRFEFSHKEGNTLTLIKYKGD
jgi:serine/threonine-protein kinase RsbW